MTLLLLFIASLVKACFVVFLLLLARGLAWLFNLFVIAPLSDPLRNLPGPEASALDTHLDHVMKRVNAYALVVFTTDAFPPALTRVPTLTSSGRKRMGKPSDSMALAGCVNWTPDILRSYFHLANALA
jgi:hypothetical protein